MHFPRVDTLCSARLDEIDVRHKNRDPGKKAEDRHQVNKVGEHLAGIIGHVEECDAGNQRREAESVNGDTTPIGAGEYGMAVAFFGKSIKRTRGDIKIAVGGGEDKDQNEGINKSRQVA